jgi:hypothetical protein
MDIFTFISKRGRKWGKQSKGKRREEKEELRP